MDGSRQRPAASSLFEDPLHGFEKPFGVDRFFDEGIAPGFVGFGVVTRLRQIVQEMASSGGKINWADWKK